MTKTVEQVTAEQVEGGAAVYTKLLLKAVYNWHVIFNRRFAWRCPISHHLKLYNQHVSDNHLDVGVGTGFLLDHCRFPSNNPRLVLFDLNPNCLAFTARRMARFQPETYRLNILEPTALKIPRFDSVGMAGLLHCLPGTIRTKAVVFEHLKELMNPGGVLFCITLLQGGAKRNWLAKILMKAYNARGIFNNTEDDLDDLREVLTQNFSESSVEVIGCTALFWGRNIS